MTDTLYQPFRLGELVLPNRVVMAPLTRNRAAAGNLATPLMAEYYRQRAGAGLIVAEGAQICPEGQGYLATPGIHDRAQAESWRQVTDAVHQAGGRIFLQLWHVGRVSHVSLQPGGAAPVGPSAVTANTKTFLGQGFEPVSPPRALDIAEIPGIVAAYARAAENAMLAGFDGVEIHAANGYLIDQFLKDGSNRRNDAYGGSIENRARLLDEVTRAAISAIGRGRVGVRLSPLGPINDCADSDPWPLFTHAVERLDAIGPVYLHVIEGVTGVARDTVFDFAGLRKRFHGAWIANNCYDSPLAAQAIAAGRADLVSFGRPFIANPDLVERMRRDLPLAQLDRATLYGGDARGYTDYPAAT